MKNLNEKFEILETLEERIITINGDVEDDVYRHNFITEFYNINYDTKEELSIEEKLEQIKENTEIFQLFIDNYYDLVNENIEKTTEYLNSNYENKDNKIFTELKEIQTMFDEL